MEIFDKDDINKDSIDKDNKNKDKDIVKFGDFEEDWEEVEKTPDYTFLKALYDFLNKKSYPKKSTRKFLRKAFELVESGEISKDSLDDFIDNENINKKIVKEMKNKFKKYRPITKLRNDDDDYRGWDYRDRDIRSC